MMSENLKKGKLLIAEPSLIGDLSFNKSVILLANHDDKGSVGFIINKPLKYNINDLIPDIKGNFIIYNGGPVEQDNLYYIHNVPNLIPNSIEISNGVYWGGEFQVTKDLINSGQLKTTNIQFFLGYTGWDQSQLQAEIRENYWIIASVNYKKNNIGIPATQFCEEQIIALGEEYLIWINAPDDPH